MNKSKIEYVDHTWNPITGCRHNCEYCYARKMSIRFSGDINRNKASVCEYKVQNSTNGTGVLYSLDRPMLSETGKFIAYPFGFEPTFHRYRMDTLGNLKMGQNIFVGAMADIFGDWVPEGWIREVVGACMNHPVHNYLFLTKNPERYKEISLPRMQNFWFGTTITCQEDVRRFNCLPAFNNRYVSIEPLLEDIEPGKHDILFHQVHWIILGAETGVRKNRVIPNPEWIKKIVVLADAHKVPVFMTDGLAHVVGEKAMRRDLPEGLRNKGISPKLKKKLESECCKCGIHKEKSKMITVSARSQRGEASKQVAFMCKDCFVKFCNELRVAVPDLKNLKEDE